jgi:hypothetical protein
MVDGVIERDTVMNEVLSEHPTKVGIVRAEANKNMRTSKVERGIFVKKHNLTPSVDVEEHLLRTIEGYRQRGCATCKV